MTPEQTAFMNQRHLPYRLNAIQVGWLLGFSSYDITVLTSNRLLKPVGRPAQNSTKFFSTAQIQALHSDVKWLDKASALLNQHWRAKNEGRHGNKTSE